MVKMNNHIRSIEWTVREGEQVLMCLYTYLILHADRQGYLNL